MNCNTTISSWHKTFLATHAIHHHGRTHTHTHTSRRMRALLILFVFCFRFWTNASVRHRDLVNAPPTACSRCKRRYRCHGTVRALTWINFAWNTRWQPPACRYFSIIFLLFNFNYFDAKRKWVATICDVQMREPIKCITRTSFRLSTAICQKIHRAEEAHRTVTRERKIWWWTEHQHRHNVCRASSLRLSQAWKWNVLTQTLSALCANPNRMHNAMKKM